MFFSIEPDKIFPYAQIDIVQIPNGLGGNDIIEKIFKGPIHQQLREALQYIRNVIITEQVATAIGLKAPRTRQLLNELVVLVLWRVQHLQKIEGM